MEIAGGKIAAIRIVRGAPCGATWEAAARMIGASIQEAAFQIGLETQFFCTANPAGWDPLYGKSPVHFAAEIHTAALIRAIEVTKRLETAASC